MTTTTGRAVGIDLGTTNSVIAVVDPDGKPTTIPSAEGDLTTPSVVFFHETSIIVGKEALKSAVFEPERVAQYAKRDMGKAAYYRPIRGRQLPPEVIQSFVLRKLRGDAELKLGAIGPAVITVPAFFNEPRRKATQDAGALAGLEVVDIINEPTAAAIAFGVRQGFLTKAGESTQPETILVYDLGGGTFDATLMRIEGRDYRALSTLGDVFLGGVDWDRRIADFLAEEFRRQHGVDPRESSEGVANLQREAEDAKKSLTARDDVVVHFAHDGNRSRIRLTRREFEEMTDDLLQRTLFTVQRLLREAKLTWDDVTRVLSIGGSTRMPMVQRAMERESGKTVDRSMSPDEAVAHGAAIYAELATRSDAASLNVIVTDINSHDLGVLGVERNTGLKRRQVLIPRNTALPATSASRFTTLRPNQANVAVNVIEGGDASGNHATQIGKCLVTDLPRNLPAGSIVEVRFTYGTSGRLAVEATVPKIGRRATLVIERSAGLSDEMIKQWIRRIEQGTLFSAEADGEAARSESGRKSRGGSRATAPKTPRPTQPRTDNTPQAGPRSQEPVDTSEDASLDLLFEEGSESSASEQSASSTDEPGRTSEQPPANSSSTTGSTGDPSLDEFLKSFRK